LTRGCSVGRHTPGGNQGPQRTPLSPSKECFAAAPSSGQVASGSLGERRALPGAVDPGVGPAASDRNAARRSGEGFVTPGVSLPVVRFEILGGIGGGKPCRVDPVARDRHRAAGSEIHLPGSPRRRAAGLGGEIPAETYLPAARNGRGVRGRVDWAAAPGEGLASAIASTEGADLASVTWSRGLTPCRWSSAARPFAWAAGSRSARRESGAGSASAARVGLGTDPRSSRSRS
jgi:hypothetical protein